MKTVPGTLVSLCESVRSGPIGKAIRACLKLKAEHNLRKMGLIADPVSRAFETRAGA